MAHIITIANYKGGVAKTETSKALGMILAQKGYKVLMIDSDPQCNLTKQLHADENEGFMKILLTGNALDEGIIQHLEAVDFIASSSALNTLRQDDLKYGITTLRAALTAPEISDAYDFIVIDTPPAYSDSSLNSLNAADTVVAPATPDLDSINGTINLKLMILSLNKTHPNRRIKLGGILLTMLDKRRVNARNMIEIANKAAAQIRTKVYGATIQPAEIVKMCKFNQEILVSRYPNRPVTLDYMQFANELLADILPDPSGGDPDE